MVGASLSSIIVKSFYSKLIKESVSLILAERGVMNIMGVGSLVEAIKALFLMYWCLFKLHACLEAITGQNRSHLASEITILLLRLK